MKLNRSELERGFQNKLFDIPVEGLQLQEVQVGGGKMECILSAEAIPEGFKISGSITIRYMESCDRCLDSFVDEHTSAITCILTPNKELIDESDPDVILFTGADHEVDLGTIFRDAILLEESFKRLCREDCKGLCPSCGINKNSGECSCAEDDSNSPWDALKQM